MAKDDLPAASLVETKAFDESLLKEVHPDIEVIKTKIWEPYDLYRKLIGKKNAKFKPGYISEATKGNWKDKISVFIRGNFLIPDPRVFWVKPSIRHLSKYLKSNHVDAIISSGPPHSMHLIALSLRKKFNIPWIADFRDPWTEIDFYNNLKLTNWADRIHHRLENKVLKKADGIVTIGPYGASRLEKISNKKVDVIFNGYDDEDFHGLNPIQTDNFIISHFGALNEDRNPKQLWKVLGTYCKKNPMFKNKLRIQLIGQTNDNVFKEIQENELDQNLIYHDFLPHKEAIELMLKSTLLLLPINDSPNVMGVLPGKMFEYLAMKIPILAIGPEKADFKYIIESTGAGYVFNFDDSENLHDFIFNFFIEFLENKIKFKSDSIEKYSRKNQSEKFIEILINVIFKHHKKGFYI